MVWVTIVNLNSYPTFEVNFIICNVVQFFVKDVNIYCILIKILDEFVQNKSSIIQKCN